MREDGLWVSDLLKRTGELAGEMCVVKSMMTEQINHGPGVTFMQTGFQIPGRPAIGAWLSYGLGSSQSRLAVVCGHDQPGPRADAGAILASVGLASCPENTKGSSFGPAAIRSSS